MRKTPVFIDDLVLKVTRCHNKAPVSVARINVAISWIPSPRRHLHATRESTSYCKIDFSASTLDENTPAFPLGWSMTLYQTLTWQIQRRFVATPFNSFGYFRILSNPLINNVVSSVDDWWENKRAFQISRWKVKSSIPHQRKFLLRSTTENCFHTQID